MIPQGHRPEEEGRNPNRAPKEVSNYPGFGSMCAGIGDPNSPNTSRPGQSSIGIGGNRPMHRNSGSTPNGRYPKETERKGKRVGMTQRISHALNQSRVFRSILYLCIYIAIAVTALVIMEGFRN